VIYIDFTPCFCGVLFFETKPELSWFGAAKFGLISVLWCVLSCTSLNCVMLFSFPSDMYFLVLHRSERTVYDCMK
jgi:hypothetical protein